MNKTLLLVPLEDIVVFPNMSVTLPVDVGDEERVLLVPAARERVRRGRHRGRRGRPVRLPGGGRAVELDGLHRGVPAPRRPTRRASCASRSRSAPTTSRVDGKTRELEREYRAVVEEILELRGDDGRVAHVPALDPRARRAGGHLRLLARPDLRAEGRAAGDRGRDRAARAGAEPPARAARRAAGAPAHPRRRRRTAPRSSSASTSCASRWSRSARSSARTTRRSSTSTARRSRRPACRRTCASRPRRSWAASSAWASSRARAR